jgi:hypothetical protein
MKQPDQKKHYEQRYQSFLIKITQAGQYTPRARYLYPLMDGVPFKDLEVALDMLAIAHKKTNDNQA